jgi:hypothetical protein
LLMWLLIWLVELYRLLLKGFHLLMWLNDGVVTALTSLLM